MLFRFGVSLIALFTTASIVFCEYVLTYHGLFDVRGTAYEWLYHLLPVGFGDTSTSEALLTVVIYTLPECFAVLFLYHVYASIGRSLGLAPSGQPTYA